MEENGLLSSPVRRVAVYSLALNISLVSIKYLLSVATGSLALRADAVHSLVDVFASIALILGLVISTRKSPKFPYGLYKIENVVSVVIALLLFLTAYEIVQQALFEDTAAVSYDLPVLVVVALLIPVPFLFGRYEMHVGRRYNSPGLVADGNQFTADVLSSAIVFLGLVGSAFGLPLDRIAAVIVAVFILRAGWGILVDGMRVLLDASVDQKTLEEIRGFILAEPAVADVRRITGRNSGRYVFVEADVAFRIDDLEQAHRISERIKETIRDTIPRVDRVVLHLEPASVTHTRYAVALGDEEGTISPHFGEAPLFAIIDFDRSAGKVDEMRLITNPYTEVEKGKGMQTARRLLTEKPDVVVTRERMAGKGPAYLFAEAGVEVLRTEIPLLKEFLQAVRSGEGTEPDEISAAANHGQE
ncbi:cation diffusion facilitator family transporter [Methanoculleus sp. FWC-SCC1]|uniref:Cation diffusion facilitator family transporter n=2 Tax=Methanoculleus frigidifontis TaxID=2584085 RepID=A0ABT8MDG0_9EURY|nr:cation diffusion facilitator family transporter [Methanoculleus sp. FWC-SCC1]